MKKISIIGAGFSGLTLALRLAQQGFQVEIYDKNSRPGGLISTEKTEHGLVESAANSVIATQRMQNLFLELGIQSVKPLETSKRRFIFRTKPHQWPLGIFETLGFVLRLVPRFIFARTSLKPESQQTLLAWGEKFMGKKATRFLLGPAMQGIYANEISGLSSKLILGPLFQPGREKYKGLLSGEQGLQTLTDGLFNKLSEMGVKFYLNSQPALSSFTNPVVVATSASAAAELLKEKDPLKSQILAKIPMSSLISSTLFFKAPQTRYQGFGCLIPRGLDLKTLGILMNPYIFPHRDRVYNETWLIGGRGEEALLKLNDAEILQRIAEERFRILGAKEGLHDYRIHRWDNALPYYGLDLEKALKELNALPASKEVYLHGNYLSGIGLSKILERTEKLALQIGANNV